MTHRLKVPAGSESVSFGPHKFVADKRGHIKVEDDRVAFHLLDHGGCTPGDPDAGPEVKIHDGLLGSEDAPDVINMPDGSKLPFGDLVKQAHADTGLTKEQWNELSQQLREDALRTKFRNLVLAMQQDMEKEKAPPAPAGSADTKQPPPDGAKDEA